MMYCFYSDEKLKSYINSLIFNFICYIINIIYFDKVALKKYNTAQN
jgi:hypothetical protein